MTLSFSDASSPEASTEIDRVKSPLVTAVATSAIARTCVGQVGGELVHVVGEVTPQARSTRHPRLSTEFALDTHFAGHVRHLIGEGRERVDHLVDGLGECRDLALGVHGQLALEIALRNRRHDAGDAAHLTGEVVRHHVDVVGQVLPRSADAAYLRLAAELAFDAHFARHARHFGREGVELIHHGVDGRFQLEDLTPDIDGDLLRQIAIRHCGGHFGDVTHLTGEVRGHHVHVVGQILPDAADAAHLRLSAELAFGAHLARHARHLAGEGVELIHHGVDGRFQLQNFAFDSHRNLLREVAVRHCGRDFGDVTHLTGEVRGHHVHVVGQILPDAADAASPAPVRRACLRCPLRAPRASLRRRRN